MFATKELLAVMSSRQFDWDVTLTFVGRYKGIISVSLAVVEVLGIPFALPPSPFAPMGESISIGVDAMVQDSFSGGLRDVREYFKVCQIRKFTMTSIMKIQFT